MRQLARSNHSRLDGSGKIVARKKKEWLMIFHWISNRQRIAHGVLGRCFVSAQVHAYAWRTFGALLDVYKLIHLCFRVFLLHHTNIRLQKKTCGSIVWPRCRRARQKVNISPRLLTPLLGHMHKSDLAYLGRLSGVARYRTMRSIGRK